MVFWECVCSRKDHKNCWKYQVGKWEFLCEFKAAKRAIWELVAPTGFKGEHRAQSNSAVWQPVAPSVPCLVGNARSYGVFGRPFHPLFTRSEPNSRPYGAYH